jgi:sigma-B regulation protein RsbU (phosphoserine phosphatase)
MLRCGSGLPLGVYPDCRYEDHTVKLSPGDTVLLYSDGLTEARGRNDELYGDARLCARLDEVAHLPVERVLEAVRQDVDRFLNGLDLSDDMTIVVARFCPPDRAVRQP